MKKLDYKLVNGKLIIKDKQSIFMFIDIDMNMNKKAGYFQNSSFIFNGCFLTA